MVERLVPHWGQSNARPLSEAIRSGAQATVLHMPKASCGGTLLKLLVQHRWLVHRGERMRNNEAGSGFCGSPGLRNVAEAGCTKPGSLSASRFS